jgi:phosphatidylglycerophosphate synthase
MLGTVITLYSQKLWVMAATGAFSFFLLIFIAYRTWTPRNSFGIANLLTLSRLLVVLWIAVCYHRFADHTIIILSILVLIGDGIDGLIAVRRKEVSVFGEYFDKETDSFFLHVLILTGIFSGLLPEWLVFIGLLRYLFMLYLLAAARTDRKESRSKLGRYIFVYSCLAFTLPFLRIPELYLPAVGLAAVFLLYSFARDIIWIHSSSSKSD